MSSLRANCIGAAAGLLLDRALGEPPDSVHPVVWFGNSMQRVESTIWSDGRIRGVAYTASGVGLGALAGSAVRSTTAVVALACAGRSLREAAERIGQATQDDDLTTARDLLPWLVGRDPSELDASGITSAVVESLAENSVDAVIAPVFWAVIAGAPGAAAYRAINTMDAMVGHRSERYRNFGWSAARLDDMANYIPARLYALLVAAQSPAQATELFETIRRDAPAHPSPNGGVAETAMASLLGRQVGGPLRYGDRVENRPTLGDGPRPSPHDIPRSIQITDRVELTAIGVLVLVALIETFRRRL